MPLTKKNSNSMTLWLIRIPVIVSPYTLLSSTLKIKLDQLKLKPCCLKFLVLKAVKLLLVDQGSIMTEKRLTIRFHILRASHSKLIM